MILEKNGKRKEVYTGFSWGVFFLGCLCPLFRGDFVGFIIQFIGLTLFSAITAPFMCFGGWLLWLYLCFNYNSIYKKRLIEKGYTEL